MHACVIGFGEINKIKIKKIGLIDHRGNFIKNTKFCQVPWKYSWPEEGKKQ